MGTMVDFFTFSYYPNMPHWIESYIKDPYRGIKMLKATDMPSPTLSLSRQIEMLLSRYACREGDSCTDIDCPLCELRQAYKTALAQMEDALNSFVLVAEVDGDVMRGQAQ